MKSSISELMGIKAEDIDHDSKYVVVTRHRLSNKVLYTSLPLSHVDAINACLLLKWSQSHQNHRIRKESDG